MICTPHNMITLTIDTISQPYTITRTCMQAAPIYQCVAWQTRVNSQCPIWKVWWCVEISVSHIRRWSTCNGWEEQNHDFLNIVMFLQILPILFVCLVLVKKYVWFWFSLGNTIIFLNIFNYQTSCYKKRRCWYR